MEPGDRLQLQQQSGGWELLDAAGFVVGRLARSFQPPAGMDYVNATVAAVVSRSREQSDPQYHKQLKCDRWEVVVPELVFEPTS